jgi:hypothetical protein
MQNARLEIEAKEREVGKSDACVCGMIMNDGHDVLRIPEI